MVDDEHVNSDVLVTTSWVADHLNDPRVRLVESNEDMLLYETGHIPGAVKLDWQTDQQSRTMRDFATRDEFEALMAARGIANDTTVVCYGDRSNRYAAYAYWLFKMYGHRDCRIMDGGRAKWERENRTYTRTVPDYDATAYQTQQADLSIRAFRDQVLNHIYARKPLIDVRSPEEYSGDVVRLENTHPEGAQRAGHIPGASNIPWSQAANEDGTFKAVEALREMYREQGINPSQQVITYCHIGERSAHTWFVLSQLLGYPDVRNYDGSWTEWGSLVRAPIEQEDIKIDLPPSEDPS